MSDTAMKPCRVCGEIKPLDGGFYRRAGTPDGYRTDCRDCVCMRSRKYHEMNYQAARERQREYQASHKDRVFDHYGWSCACCGTTENPSIDHVDGNGKRHREALFGRSQGRAGSTFYFWLVKQGFPPGYQTLCRRCNISKGRGERCILDHTEGEITWGLTLATTRS
jgi:hypothetical protein